MEWKNLGTHYQTTKNNWLHSKVDVTISREGNMAHAHKTEGFFGTTTDATYFAPAPSDEVILSKLSR